ncbi:MAG: 4-hydroxythreonine-4-phosphate dehydrogenase [Silanimonas sp.]|nr:MAG: 4-hydroxythreonine-4-phosphate dehydrogenase [Silanimonas sp.]
MASLPRLALVPGEPAGVGPELCVRIAQDPWPARLVAYGDGETLLAAARALGLPLRLLGPGGESAPGELPLVEHANTRPTRFGHADPSNAAAVIGALRSAAADALVGTIDGLVTGPVHKASINRGGIPYTGTTELLAEAAGSEVVMMLANPRLRVALATTHLPLRAVPGALTPALLERVLRITDAALRRDFGLTNPRLRVLGLNPHAGESGELGREEIEVIIPVLERLRAEGLRLEGPLPADTAFLPQQRGTFDAVVAMYHDQGLPVLKASGFEEAVNLTLGLPFPRVAVDHGTALELAGRGLADASSLRHAVALCARLAARRAGSQPHDEGRPA